MKCKKCHHQLLRNAAFCHICGTENRENRELLLKPPYDNVCGVWVVTTEGDLEGRTRKDLGIHAGYIDDIAKELACSCYYSLHFEYVGEYRELDNDKEIKEVNVMFSIESGLWDADPDELAEVISKLFNKYNRPVTVERGNYFASFKLVFGDEVDNDVNIK